MNLKPCWLKPYLRISKTSPAAERSRKIFVNSTIIHKSLKPDKNDPGNKLCKKLYPKGFSYCKHRKDDFRPRHLQGSTCTKKSLNPHIFLSLSSCKSAETRRHLPR
jgi:hypothetical protein